MTYSAKVIEGLGIVRNFLAGEFLNDCLREFCVLLNVCVSLHK